MKNFLSRFLRDESGATAIEYCLIAAGIGIVIVAGVDAFATALNGSLNASATKLSGYNP
jgi:pilus assembly protein Flp/PilA